MHAYIHVFWYGTYLKHSFWVCVGSGHTKKVWTCKNIIIQIGVANLGWFFEQVGDVRADLWPSHEHQRIGMERLPNEIVLIFSFVPGELLFRTVSLVCKRFNRLVYDYSSVHRCKGLFKEINLQRKSERVLCIITMLPSTVVKQFSVQDYTATWQVFDVLAPMCKVFKILNLAYMNGVLKLAGT